MKTAVISGGTYGIGRGITLRLARDGYRVVAFGIDPEHGEQTRALLKEEGADPHVLDGDASSSADVNRLIEYAADQLGGVDVLCNVAGIRPTGTVVTTDEADWDRAFEVNTKSMFLTCKAVVPVMQKAGRGSIINVASSSGFYGTNHIAYCASKGAIFPFSKSLAVDHASSGIRVNVVVPGFTITGMTENWPPEITQMVAAMSVAGRACFPEDIANAVSFLVSDQADTISGAVLEIGCLPGQMPQG